MKFSQISKFILLAITLILLMLGTTFAQTVEQSARLQQLSIELRKKFEKERNSALERANTLGLPVKMALENGRTVVLVKFENGRPVYKTTYNADGASLINTEQVLPEGSSGLGLNGNGIKIGLWDAGNPRFDHQEFGSRINIVESAGTNRHATHVAGTLIASGQDTDAKGMAPSALIDSYDFFTDQSEMSTAAGNGLLISTHPYGYNAGWEFGTFDGNNTAWYWFGSASWTDDYNFGFYDNDNARGWDEIAFNAPNYLIVTSAGNDRGKGPGFDDDKYEWDGDKWVLCDPTCPVEHELDGGTDGFDSLSDNSVAKNVMVVGAVDNTALDTKKGMWVNSTWGPTDDGRIKPDIVAKGVSVYSSNAGSIIDYGSQTGTSFSASMIAGSAALLLEHQENLHPGKALFSSTLRGLILHTAEDLGRPGPDYEYGWGLMNTLKAANVMSNNAVNKRIHIRELTIKEGQTLTFQIKASGSEPLRTSITWTDPPGTPVAIGDNPPDLMLVNDLDMRLTDSGSTTHFPYTLDPANPGNNAVSNTDNFRDNIEVVHVSNPSAGEIYTVTISHKNNLQNNEPQNFSLIITGNEGLDYQQQIAEGTGEGWRILSSAIPAATYRELLSNIWTQGSNDETAGSANAKVMLFDGSVYTMLPDLDTEIPTGSGTAVFVFDGDKNNTLSVSGLKNIGDVMLDDLLNPSNDGSEIYSLLGNPYNSTIDFDGNGASVNGFIKNADVGNVVYIYDHACDSFSSPDEPGEDAGGCFRAWNGSTGSLTDGLIAPFQGFFVFATGGNPTLTIPETSKTTGGTFYKESENLTPSMQIAARINGAYTGETWLSFTETGSIKKNSYDAPYLYPLDYKPFLSLQTRFDGTGYNIKNLPAAPDSEIQIPLVAEAWEPNQNEDSPGYQPIQGEMELIWPKMVNIPAEWAVTLSDHHLGKIVDMRRQNHYDYFTAPQKQIETGMPYKMALQKAVNKQTENTRFTITISPNGESQIVDSNLPNNFKLHQNYPNPFNPTTVIRYELPEATEVSLDVYSVNGRRVASLVNRTEPAGTYIVPFDASSLASGIYIYQLKAGSFLSTQKMILLK